ncbi:type II secretion system F family protein [Desulfobotulus sp. H1]|uniref:Type II secretion system F family protein n=1 Tax=Desulfobotulus pelophilus TaxID=2823377 RepID=A0ABT3N9C8_9BACT|nr:type II secretion system F family protein [Desulfobotulus pelophilus]MCW7754058.1 type II secretion system F family protein [Desulfobotulus pelophilus]
MQQYECRAMDPGGRMIRMMIQARDTAAAAAEMRARGLSPISVQENQGGAAGFSISQFMPVGTGDKVLLFRMLSTLIKSEVTITEAIRILHDQTDRMNVKKVLGDILIRIEGGAPLSEALSHHARVFPPMIMNLIRAGEMGGMLDIVFDRIADFLEKKSDLRKKMLMSFFYPGMVLLMGIGVVLFMVLFVIPRFMGMIQGKLPPVTQFLMDSTAFLQNHGLNMLMGTGVFIAMLFLFHALPLTRYWMDRYTIKIPVVGPVMKLGIVVGFARTFSLLLESRIPMVEALKATSATLPNTAVHRFLDQVIERVMAGEPLSSTMKNSWFFTPITTSLASIGEHSGLMSETMGTVAEVHEKLLENKIARMSAMVEPLLIITLGGVVGLVVYGLISGMLAMYSGSM